MTTPGCLKARMEGCTCPSDFEYMQGHIQSPAVRAWLIHDTCPIHSFSFNYTSRDHPSRREDDDPEEDDDDEYGEYEEEIHEREADVDEEEPT